VSSKLYFHLYILRLTFSARWGAIQWHWFFFKCHYLALLIKEIVADHVCWYHTLYAHSCVRQTLGQSACRAPQATDALTMTLRPQRLLRKWGKEFSPSALLRRRVGHTSNWCVVPLHALAKTARRNRSFAFDLINGLQRFTRCINQRFCERLGTQPRLSYSIWRWSDWGSHFSSAETKAAKSCCAIIGSGFGALLR
jgi:hypothetical protein